MINTSEIKNRYNIEALRQQKNDLEAKTLDSDFINSQDQNKGDVYADLSSKTSLLNQYQELFNKIAAYEQAQQIVSDFAQGKGDKEFVELAQTDIETLEQEIPLLDEAIKQREIEEKFRDPDDNKSVVVEIRAGAGGDEAAIFAGDLFRMYSHFAEQNNWHIEIIEASPSANNGYKELIANIKGQGVYKKLKYESGVHRVQRIPVTEASGRIHTSTASVAILPEAKDIDIIINPEDIRIDVMRASGAGGQCVNRTDSAVRITHLATGIVVSCQETKHQSQNKEKAMAILRSRLYEKKKREEAEKRDNMRNSQIGSMMRAEKIRTYNYPQSRITDHRVKLSWFNLESILNGNIEEMVSDIDKVVMEMRLQEEQS